MNGHYEIDNKQKQLKIPDVTVKFI
jgi:hypothetical protein